MAPVSEVPEAMVLPDQQWRAALALDEPNRPNCLRQKPHSVNLPCLPHTFYIVERLPSKAVGPQILNSLAVIPQRVRTQNGFTQTCLLSMD